MNKLKIVIFSGFYLPGYKAGGPIRSLANLVEKLGDEFNFKIVTKDRDFNDIRPYSGIRVNYWNQVGKAEVFYLSPQNCSLRKICTLMRSTEYDILYLNSFFSPIFTMKPLFLYWLKFIRGTPVIVAPRGEFSSGALSLKSFKKNIYLAAAKMFGLYKYVMWQASSEHEKKDISYRFGNYIKIVVAPNLSLLINKPKEKVISCKKNIGYLKIIYLSRITRMKNLYSALMILEKLNGNVQFDIYGIIDDRDYWIECKKLINLLPNNIKVRYMGAVEHDQVGVIIKEHNLFFLPTFGENFGHVILEALVSGCPVLISDQTPWRNLEKKGVGWDLPLNCPEKFQEVLQKCIDMNELEYNILSNKAYKFGLKIVEDKTALNLNRELFYKAFYNSK